MSRTSKYQKTQGYWVYVHVLPTKEVYIGISKLQPCQRWIPSNYKTTTLQPYIECFGWENIEHKVLIDRLTKQQAEQIEDWIIIKATADGFCINKQRSGGIKRDNRKEYCKAYRETHKEELLEYQKAWYEDNKEQRLEYQKTYREAHREQKKAYDKQRRSTPEGKIYNRVKNYNQTHTPIETPKEAKQKYLDWGYIPSYIKSCDLI